MSQPSLHLSLETARRLALRAQLLDDLSNLPSGEEGVYHIVERLGYIQIDTIAVVERAHHHTLWTRRPDYNPAMLHELQAKQRRVFEYWGHAASYLPMTDYRFYLPKMASYREPERNGVRGQLQEHEQLMAHILERIGAEGPLASKDFAPPPGTTRGAWWDWTPSKIALELLFWRGDLMVTERRNFQRVYDLTERVLPTGVDTRLPDEGDLGRFLVRRALTAHGLAHENTILDNIRSARRASITKAIRTLVESGEVVPATVEGFDSTTFYTLASVASDPGANLASPRRVRLLSPFDNLIIHREHLRRFFDFDYTIECYVPAAKRRYGYFSLPILWGDRLVGRLDPKAERKRRTLLIRNLVFEPTFQIDDEFLAAFGHAAFSFARFNGCDAVELETTVPASFHQPIGRALSSH